MYHAENAAPSPLRVVIALCVKLHLCTIKTKFGLVSESNHPATCIAPPVPLAVLLMKVVATMVTVHGINDSPLCIPGP